MATKLFKMPKKPLTWSLSLHFAFFLLIFIQGIFFKKTPRLHTPTLRVDLVGLPDILKKDLSQVSPDRSQTQTEVATEKEKPTSIKSKEKSPSIQSSLKRIKALEKISSQEAEENKKNSTLLKGNKVTKGNSVSADARETGENEYYDSVREAVQNNWTLPIWLSRQALTAQVEIHIDAEGRILTYRLIQSSGHAQFDEAVRRAVEKSEPFPKPPAELASVLRRDGILLGFPL